METKTRKEKMSGIRERLANLTEDQKAAIVARGIIGTVEGRTLSVRNTMLCYLQSDGRAPTVVGGYRQWLKAGRQVKKGEHGVTILFPSIGKPKNSETKETTDIYFMAATVFDISQTEPVVLIEAEVRA